MTSVQVLLCCTTSGGAASRASTTHGMHARKHPLCPAPLPLPTQTAREVHFRHNYGAAVLSVHRAGTTLTGDVADIKLQPGDVLVLEAGPEFSHVFAHHPAFALISQVRKLTGVGRACLSDLWLVFQISASRGGV